LKYSRSLLTNTRSPRLKTLSRSSSMTCVAGFGTSNPWSKTAPPLSIVIRCYLYASNVARDAVDVRRFGLFRAGAVGRTGEFRKPPRRV
jgi:hypothetical protein